MEPRVFGMAHTVSGNRRTLRLPFRGTILPVTWGPPRMAGLFALLTASVPRPYARDNSTLLQQRMFSESPAVAIIDSNQSLDQRTGTLFGGGSVPGRRNFSTRPTLPIGPWHGSICRRRKSSAFRFCWQQRFRFCRLGANGRKPSMKDYDQIWNLAVGTFMAVSVASGIAFIVAFNSF